MKTIGLIGGMSWESTVTYYQIINEVVGQRLGGLHSAKLLLYSVDFAEIEEQQFKGEWDKSTVVLSRAAVCLESAGVDFIVICTNTMHKVVPDIQAHLSIPIIHIADSTVEVLKKRGIFKVGLLGTRYTMTQAFYKQRLTDAGIAVIIPGEEDIEMVDDVIYHELCLGIVSKESKRKYLGVIDRLERMGAQGVILGCTEIGLLVQQADTKLPVFDTTRIHATKAACFAIER